MQFLSRKSITSIKSTLKKADELHRMARQAVRVRRALTASLETLTTDNNLLKEVLSMLVKRKGFEPTDSQLDQFIDSREQHIQMVPTKLSKPRSFALPVQGKSKGAFKKIKGWNALVHELAIQTYKRHPKGFEDRVLDMPKSRFHRSPKDPDKGYLRVGNSSIYFKTFGDSQALRNLGYNLVTTFGYNQEDLIIKYK